MRQCWSAIGMMHFAAMCVQHGSTALALASEFSPSSVAELLIQKGAQVDISTKVCRKKIEPNNNGIVNFQWATEFQT